MNYRSFADRKVSAYIAIILITIIGSAATLSILHAIKTVDFEYAQAAAYEY